MKVLMINVVCGIRSTGRICTDLAQALEAQGHEVKIAYGRGEVPEQYRKYAVRIGTDFDIKLSGIEARILDNAGFSNKRATKKFIEWVKKYDPEVIHIHNIHGYYINIEILFDYLRHCGKKIIWTLHDCWAFTGHCTYFEYTGCEKWKTKCRHCPQKREYPASYICDNSRTNYQRKKKIFRGIKNVKIIVPSKWLQKKVETSFLKAYPVTVIHNGIDTKSFRKTESNLRKRYNLCHKMIILGVASVWDRRKGLNFFLRLAEDLPINYKIVLIGLTNEQLKNIPGEILGLGETNSTSELAAWYSTANIYVNPTLEDNYPTTNLEAIACGTPVITFKTGGSPESAQYYGKAIDKGDYDALFKAIVAYKEYDYENNSNEELISKYNMVNQYLLSYLE